MTADLLWRREESPLRAPVNWNMEANRQQQHNGAITGSPSTSSESPRVHWLFFTSAANCRFISTSLKVQQCSGSTLSREDLITRETTEESDGQYASRIIFTSQAKPGSTKGTEDTEMGFIKTNTSATLRNRLGILWVVGIGEGGFEIIVIKLLKVFVSNSLEGGRKSYFMSWTLWQQRVGSCILCNVTGTFCTLIGFNANSI